MLNFNAITVRLGGRVILDRAGAALLLATTPLLVGGAIVLTVALAGATSPVGAWLTSIFGSSKSRTQRMRDELARYARGEQSFSSLRRAIVGSAKGAVVNVFGPPRTALLGRGAHRMSIWRAETWYYPLDRADRCAIAIRFEGNVARDVEKIGVPSGEARMTKPE